MLNRFAGVCALLVLSSPAFGAERSISLGGYFYIAPEEVVRVMACHPSDHSVTLNGVTVFQGSNYIWLLRVKVGDAFILNKRKELFLSLKECVATFEETPDKP